MHRGLALITVTALAVAACGKRAASQGAPYVPLAAVEAAFGPLITAGNHPTPDQNGTGERVGLFRDSSGTVWGFPLSAAADGAVLACAPPQVRDEKVTGAFPAGATIIGSTNRLAGVAAPEI